MYNEASTTLLSSLSVKSICFARRGWLGYADKNFIILDKMSDLVDELNAKLKLAGDEIFEKINKRINQLTRENDALKQA